MKQKIPFKLLAIIWTGIILFLSALQYAAPDIPYFIFNTNALILGLIAIFPTALYFFLTRQKFDKPFFAKLFSYLSHTAIIFITYNIVSHIWAYHYPQTSQSDDLLNQFFFAFYLVGLVIVFEFVFLLLHQWNKLRKRSITLNLTQTISIIVLIIPTALMIASMFINLFVNRHGVNYAYTPPTTYLGKLFVTIATQLFPVTGVSIVAGIFAMIIAVPFVALFSWILANYFTKRLKLLVDSVNEMKQGHLSERIQIKGEDEISRLMEDFNEMSASLEAQQNELMEKQEKISGLLDSQKEWLLKISHELRTPITTMKAVLESSPAETLQESYEKNAILQQEIDGLHHLIEDLFTLTQSEHMQLSLDMQPLQIPDELHTMIEPLQHYAWEKKKIEFIFKPTEEKCVISTDHFRLAQILRNLTQNAVRHTETGGLISLEIEIQENELLLHFRDTGEGIPEEMRNVIWQPFQKHPRSDGSGIGLSLVKELVEIMGGSISLQSQSSCGACFLLKFPIIKQ
jgi:signal transduction histidine kinase